MKKPFLLFLLGLLFITSGKIKAQCTLNATSNAELYEQAVSGFHGGIYQGYVGGTGVAALHGWGEQMGADGTTNVADRVINTANGYTYTGTLLKWGAASDGGSYHQYTLLTTDGLWAWGTTNVLYSTAVKATTNFGGVSGITSATAQDMPTGYTPSQVISFYTGYGTIAIVMSDGTGWVLTTTTYANTTGAASNSWKQVNKAANTPLTGIQAIRGASGGFSGGGCLIADCGTNGVYVWGIKTYLGNGTAASDRQYATAMVLTTPGFTDPKMVQANFDGSASTFYILSSGGKLYCVGSNGMGQMGTGSSSTNWVQPPANANGFNPNSVNFISSNEHDNYGYA